MSAAVSFIDFKAHESPAWRNEDVPIPSVSKMVNAIVEFQSRWEHWKKSVDEKIVDEVLNETLVKFIYCIHNGEEHGCGTKEEIEWCLKQRDTPERPLSDQERETINLRNAYTFLLDEVKKVEDSTEVEKVHGLLSLDLVKNAHELILYDIKLSVSTKAGQLSTNERYTDYKGERYYYQNPEDMGKAFQDLLDNHNDLIKYYVKEEEDPKARVYNMFKICSWLLFEFLDLHPFSDGNGRLCRLLCSYVLSSMTPFPTPVYNVWSTSKKDDYIDALVATRESDTRHPTSLTTMIIECNYLGWKEFFNILEKSVEKDGAVQ